jgi:hypothetical protein
MLVNGAPLTLHDKHSINHSIRKVEAALNDAKRGRHPNDKHEYANNLFYENMFLEEKNINQVGNTPIKPKPTTSSSSELEYSSLLDQYQRIRSLRLKKEQCLNSLIIKAQRMERLANLMQENHQKCRATKALKEEHDRRKKEE